VSIEGKEVRLYKRDYNAGQGKEKPSNFLCGAHFPRGFFGVSTKDPLETVHRDTHEGLK
jgi:hypothetical protein